MSIVRRSERIEKVPARSGWIVGDPSLTSAWGLPETPGKAEIWVMSGMQVIRPESQDRSHRCSIRASAI